MARLAQEGQRLAQEGQQAAGAHTADLRRRSRILRVVLLGTAIVAVIAVVAAVVAVVGFGRATVKRVMHWPPSSTPKARRSFGATADSDIRALADTLAAQRLRSDPTASNGAFYTATTALNTTRIIIPTPVAVYAVAVSPDGHTLASGNRDGTVRLWNLTDPAHPVPLGRP